MVEHTEKYMELYIRLNDIIVMLKSLQEDVKCVYVLTLDSNLRDKQD